MKALYAFHEVQEGRSDLEALELRLPFGEKEVLEENLEVIKRQIGVEEVQVFVNKVILMPLLNLVLLLN